MDRTRQRLAQYSLLVRYCRETEDRIESAYESGSHLIGSYEETRSSNYHDKLHVGARLAEDERFQRSKQLLVDAKWELSQIEGAIRTLPKAEEKIIRMRYCQDKPKGWAKISAETGYSERRCQKLHDQALNMVDIALYGFRDWFRTREG